MGTVIVDSIKTTVTRNEDTIFVNFYMATGSTHLAARWERGKKYCNLTAKSTDMLGHDVLEEFCRAYLKAREEEKALCATS
jgi:hypothetical protein